MIEYRVTNIEDYLKYTEKYKGNAYFRGQANAAWAVEPSIFRDSNLLNDEVNTLGIQYSNKKLDVLSQLLKKQHYGTKTRLCDLTINPLVALYFSIEDETVDDKDACIYVYDDSSAILGDSVESRLMLLLATQKISTIHELQIRYEEEYEKIDIDLIEGVIKENHIIDYDYNFAYTNTRSYLQGGTGILYGFGISKGFITRKGTLDIDCLVEKIYISAEYKPIIRNYLKNAGICKEVLYDDICSTNPLTYTVKKENKNSPAVKKIMLDILISDVMFEKTDIEKIVEDTYCKYRELDVLIFGYIYYDEQDKRNYNWIAMPQLKQGKFDLKYNDNYHKRRMDYMNKEISIDTIVLLTEPIVKKCREIQKHVEKRLQYYIEENGTVKDYKCEIDLKRSELYKIVYYDLQDIEHGAKQYDAYYNFSNEYCMNVDKLLESQKQWDTFEHLRFKMDSDKQDCDDIFAKFEKARKTIL